jgi:predicted DNA-binding transcriptional regulator AlpA
MNDADEILLTHREVQRILGVSDATLRGLWRSGRFPKPKMVGARLKWPRSVVVAWIREPTTVEASASTNQDICED